MAWQAGYQAGPGSQGWKKGPVPHNRERMKRNHLVNQKLGKQLLSGKNSGPHFRPQQMCMRGCPKGHWEPGTTQDEIGLVFYSI